MMLNGLNIARGLTAFSLLVALTACSSAQTKKQQEENDALRTQLGETRTVVASLQGRLDSLEAKLTAMNDKFDATRISVDNFMNSQRAKPAGVRGHSAEGGGTAVAPSEEEAVQTHDPEAGFSRDEAIQAYRKAMVLFHAERYPEAVLSFSSFVEAFPDHPLAGSAQYYVGESYFRQKEYKLALQEFKRVITSYDRSSHVAETLREMAAAEDMLRLPQDAARHRQLLSSLFPQSPAASMGNVKHAAAAEGEAAKPETAKPETAKPETAKPESAKPEAAAGGPALDEPPPPTAPLGTGGKVDTTASPGAEKTHE